MILQGAVGRVPAAATKGVNRMKQIKSSQIPSRHAAWMVAGAMSAFLVAPGMAWAINEAASVARGAQPDTTAQQRYQSAIREAGGGRKVALEECRQQPAPEQKACRAQAQTTYQQDMAQARAMLRDPSVRPVNEVGGPVRSTETVTVIKP